MSSLRFATLICLLVLGGCASAPSTVPYDIDGLGESLVRTICGDTAPTHVQSVPNPHVDGVTDTIEQRSCPIGTSTLYKSTQASNPNGLAMRLEIRQSGSGVPNFLDIGASVSDAVKRLGSPASQTGNSTTYVFGDLEDTFIIEAQGGVIRSLSWSWTVD
ncbi:MAG: hypothetical protein H0U76_13075 [Ktedonobacteraceae bacterium]|nr:hypothetical protein [Ktedonobacteraceae bacterium]